jgi:hypothetical protein
MAFFPIFNYPPIILCSNRNIRIRLPNGEPAEIPESEFGTGSSGNETWTEVSRVTSVVTTDAGEVERIDRLVMQKSGGGQVTLVFRNTSSSE